MKDVKKELDAGSMPSVEKMKNTISLTMKVMERSMNQK